MASKKVSRFSNLKSRKNSLHQEQNASVYIQIEPTRLHVELSINHEIGRFDIKQQHGTWAMTINVNEEHQGKGFSTLMIRRACEAAKQANLFRATQYLYIDTDASGGFWKKIGMEDNPFYSDKKGEGSGYELRITFQDLCKYVKVPIERMSVKSRKSKTKTISLSGFDF